MKVGAKWGLIVGIPVILVVGLAIAVVVRARSFDYGAPPPDLAQVQNVPITMPDGRKAVLGDAIRPGVPTVINFWASWCGPCFDEAPLIADLRHKYGPDKLNLVYLNVRDQDASPESLASYMVSFHMNPSGYAVLEDGYIAALTNTGTSFVPRTLIYDKDGKAIGRITGFRRLAVKRIEGIVADEQT